MRRRPLLSIVPFRSFPRPAWHLALVLGFTGACGSGPAEKTELGTGSSSASIGGSGPMTTSGPSSATSSSTAGSATVTAVTSVGGSGQQGFGGSATTGGGGQPTTSGASTTDTSSTGAAGATVGGAGGSTTETTTTSTTGAQLGPATVWIAGDSTVANGNTPCPAGWGKHFAALFDDRVTVNNAAVGGRSVRTWLYNVTSEMDEATGECLLTLDGSGTPTLQDRWQTMLDGMQAGDFLLIQFGINDGSPTCDRHVGLEAFEESYGVMAEAAKARGTQPVFITPVSAVACNGDSARATRGGYVDATFEAGLQYDVPVVDLHQASIELYDALGFCPIPGGDVSAETTGPVGDFFCDDHTHFSDSGAPQIAALVAAALEPAGVALSSYLLK